MHANVIRRMIAKEDAKLVRQRAAVEETEQHLAILIGQLEIAEKQTALPLKTDTK